MPVNRILLLPLLSVFVSAYGQVQGKHAIGFSIPFIVSTTETKYYILGNPKYSVATAWSYGLELNYRRDFHSGLWGGLSLGYFKEQFNNKRPFKFAYDSGLLLISTDHYSYDNVKLSITAGLRHRLKDLSARESITYHYLHSFHQKYVPAIHTTFSYADYQVENKNYKFGEMITANFELSRIISKQNSMGLGLIVPLYTRWRKDAIFWENPNEYYHSKYGGGLSFSINHIF
jgi:hypothetical protein